MATMKYKSLYIITITIGLFGLSTFSCRATDKEQDSKSRAVEESRQLVNQALPSLDIPVDGNAFKAFLVAYELFSKDEQIPVNKRSILQHNVKILRESKLYVVAFRAKRNMSSLTNLEYGGATDFGVDVDYYINSENYIFQKRLFYQ